MFDNDRERGKVILISVLVLFLYYSIWTIGLPFIDDDRLQNLGFYSQNFTLILPAISGLFFIGGLVLFTLYHLKSVIYVKQ